jgi:hypothetical protein
VKPQEWDRKYQTKVENRSSRDIKAMSKIPNFWISLRQKAKKDEIYTVL